MSSLWTPSGEHQVPPEQQQTGQQQPGGAYPQSDHDVGAPSPFGDALDIDPDTGMPIDPRTGEPVDAETLAAMQDRLHEAQEQLVSVPAAEIVQNHMMGLFELAALHLQRDPPDLNEARLPIDALSLLVENLGDQLPEGDTLAGALQQIRLAYVEIHKQLTQA